MGTVHDQQHLQAVENEEGQPPLSSTSSTTTSATVPYSVVNFYHLTDVEHPFRVSLRQLR